MSPTAFSMSKKTVESFLTEMKALLCKDDFDIEREFLFVKDRQEDDPEDEFTNSNTMIELGYDTWDVIEHLKTLTIQEYTGFMPDDKPGKDEGVCFFFVFGRKIDGRDVYIKARMKQKKTGKIVFCVSFHFARHIITEFPFK